MNKKVLIGTCGVLALTMIGCTKNENNAATSSSDAQIANPFVDCDTIEDAEKEAGFSILVPDSIEGYSTRVIRVLVDEENQDQNMIEVIYYNEDAEDEIRICKMTDGQKDSDISGDYNTYDIVNTQNLDGTSVTTKGNEEGLYNVAIYETTDGTYSVTATLGLDLATLTSLIAQIK